VHDEIRNSHCITTADFPAWERGQGWICGYSRCGYGSEAAGNGYIWIAPPYISKDKNHPQFISQEISINQTRTYLEEACPKGNFTFQAMPYRNHTDSWILRDIPERKKLREWFRSVLDRSRAWGTALPSIP
jgi:hypothetical protein